MLNITIARTKTSNWTIAFPTMQQPQQNCHDATVATTASCRETSWTIDCCPLRWSASKTIRTRVLGERASAFELREAHIRAVKGQNPSLHALRETNVEGKEANGETHNQTFRHDDSRLRLARRHSSFFPFTVTLTVRPGSRFLLASKCGRWAFFYLAASSTKAAPPVFVHVYRVYGHIYIYIARFLWRIMHNNGSNIMHPLLRGREETPSLLSSVRPPRPSFFPQSLVAGFASLLFVAWTPGRRRL